MRLLWIAAAVFVLAAGGCGSNQGDGDPPRERPVISVEFRAASDSELPGYLRMVLDGTSRTYYVSEQIDLTVDGIARAELDTLGREHPAVSLILTEDGAAIFNRLTRERLGKRVGIIVDGLLVSAPLVMAEITGNRAMIDGRFTLHDAQRIVDKINQ